MIAGLEISASRCADELDAGSAILRQSPPSSKDFLRAAVLAEAAAARCRVLYERAVLRELEEAEVGRRRLLDFHGRAP